MRTVYVRTHAVHCCYRFIQNRSSHRGAINWESDTQNPYTTQPTHMRPRPFAVRKTSFKFRAHRQYHGYARAFFSPVTSVRLVCHHVRCDICVSLASTANFFLRLFSLSDCGDRRNGDAYNLGGHWHWCKIEHKLMMRCWCLNKSKTIYTMIFRIDTWDTHSQHTLLLLIFVFPLNFSKTNLYRRRIYINRFPYSSMPMCVPLCECECVTGAFWVVRLVRATMFATPAVAVFYCWVNWPVDSENHVVSFMVVAQRIVWLSSSFKGVNKYRTWLSSSISVNCNFARYQLFRISCFQRCNNTTLSMPKAESRTTVDDYTLCSRNNYIHIIMLLCSWYAICFYAITPKEENKICRTELQ